VEHLRCDPAPSLPVAHFRDGWSADYLSEDDRALYDALPERFTAYRGQDFLAAAGLSWTLNRDAAARFALGHRGIRYAHPVVISATINKRNVVAGYAEREESEIVIFSPQCAFAREVEARRPWAVSGPMGGHAG
jgi:hypothetical protein